MDGELERYHKTNSGLDLLISNLRLKQAGLQAEVLSQRTGKSDAEGALRRLQHDLQAVVVFIQEPKQLKVIRFPACLSDSLISNYHSPSHSYSHICGAMAALSALPLSPRLCRSVSRGCIKSTVQTRPVGWMSRGVTLSERQRASGSTWRKRCAWAHDHMPESAWALWVHEHMPAFAQMLTRSSAVVQPI